MSSSASSTFIRHPLRTPCPTIIQSEYTGPDYEILHHIDGSDGVQTRVITDGIRDIKRTAIQIRNKFSHRSVSVSDRLQVPSEQDDIIVFSSHTAIQHMLSDHYTRSYKVIFDVVTMTSSIMFLVKILEAKGIEYIFVRDLEDVTITLDHYSLMVLKLLVHSYDPTKYLDPETVDRSMGILIDKQCISISSRILPRGIFVSRLPFSSLNLGVMMDMAFRKYLSVETETARVTLMFTSVIASILDNGFSPFLTMEELPEGTIVWNKRFNGMYGSTSIHVYVNVFWSYYNQIFNGAAYDNVVHSRNYENDLVEWATKHYIHHDTLLDILALVGESEKIINGSPDGRDLTFLTSPTFANRDGGGVFGERVALLFADAFHEDVFKGEADGTYYGHGRSYMVDPLMNVGTDQRPITAHAHINPFTDMIDVLVKVDTDNDLDEAFFE